MPGPPSDPLLGVQLGAYVIQSLLGRGGSADVYLALRGAKREQVALKVLRDGSDPAAVAAFEREAHTAAALHHPHLVAVDAIDSIDGHHFLAMEYVAGGTLAQRIKSSGPLAWQPAVRMTMQITRALQCAHARGMLHGDIKPANVLLTTDGDAKLGDLGLAGASFRIGTKAFMAPERILNQDVDVRSDLYSMGCTLYAMLTGEVPFPHAQSKEMLVAHVREKPRPIHLSGMVVPDELESLISQLLAKQPHQRPADAESLLERLEAVLEATDPLAQSGGPKRAPTRSPSRASGSPTPAPAQSAPDNRTAAVENAPLPSPSRRLRAQGVRSRPARRFPWSILIGFVILAAGIGFAVWAWREFT